MEADFLEQIHAANECSQDLLHQVMAFNELVRQRKAKQDADIIKMKNDNQKLKDDIFKEEQWIKCIANDIINEEEAFKVSLLQAVWELSRFDSNLEDIYEYRETIIEYIASEMKPNVIAACFGILGNISANSDYREKFIEENTTSVGQLCSNAKNIIDSSESFGIDMKEALSYLNNISLNKFMANSIIQTGIIESISNVIDKFKTEDTAIDLLIHFSITLINNTQKHPFEECQLLYHNVLKLEPRTSEMIALLSILPH